MYTPSPAPTGAHVSRIARDVRAAVCAVVARLTIKLLEPGAGVASKDAYVVNARRDIGKGKAAALQMVAAIAYDDIVHKGRSAAEATAWAAELIEEARAWEADRDGRKITPPDLMPVLHVESRREGVENQVSLDAGLGQNDPAFLERLITAHQDEIEASMDVVDVARRRLVLVQREA